MKKLLMIGAAAIGLAAHAAEPSTFYLVGTFSDFQTDDAYRLTQHPEHENEYTLSGITLSKDDYFQVVETDSEGSMSSWYPGGMNVDYLIEADGTYDIYFRPNRDGGDKWYYNCIYVVDHTVVVKHTITWKLDDNTVIDTTEVAEDLLPTHTDPAKADEGIYSYRFAGWTPALAPVDADATYTATYAKYVDLSKLSDAYTAQDGDELIGSTEYAVTIPSGAKVSVNGVSITGAGGGSSETVIDLSAVSGDTVAADGAVLTGELGADVKVSIADGATVTLRDVTINGENWAGITCEGDATIILAGENTVNESCSDNPCIFVPENKTLTIRGDGSLNAISSERAAAGIGGGYGRPCGNIIIEGGTIIATGGDFSAGIGGGLRSSCGDITITKGVTCVTATKGEDAPSSIGAGYKGTCGTVTIGGEAVGDITASPFTYPENVVNLSALTGPYEAKAGDVLIGEAAYDVTIPGGAKVSVNGVEIAAGGTELPKPAFSDGGKAATTEFVKGEGNKWTLTTFAELSNDAVGADVAAGQIKVYAADSVEELKTAEPLTSGVEVTEKKSAVKTTIEVTPPDPTAPAQFFKVEFGE